jgi:outer membrane autotransporter protein
MRKGLSSAKFAQVVSFTVLYSFALASSVIAQNATRQGNNLTVQCDGNFTPVQTLCKDGNRCGNLPTSFNPAPASNSGQDNVFFVTSPANQNVDLTWEVQQLDVTVDPPGPNTAELSADSVIVDFNGPATTPSTPQTIDDTNAAIPPNTPPAPPFPHTYTQTGVNTPPPVNISITTPNPQEFGVAQYRVMCTVRKGKLTINKVSISGTGTFPIVATPTVGGPLNYSINTAVSTSQTQDVAPGTYTISESPPAGWVLNSVQCGNSNTATAVVSSDAETTCTVTNTLQVAGKGKIVIDKIAFGGDGVTPFGFTAAGKDVGGPNVDVAGFSLTPPANGLAPVPQTFANLTPGDFTVTETPVPGWTTEIKCEEDKTINTTTTQPNVASIKVEADETVRCTFKNTRNTGKLTINKLTTGGDGAFTFAVTGQPLFQLTAGGSNALTLPTGPYTITETNLPAGWKLQNISNCGTVDLATNSVAVNVTTAGATCTFTNTDTTKTPAVIRRFLSHRLDGLLAEGPDRSRMLRRVQGRSAPEEDHQPMKFTASGDGANYTANFSTSLSQMLAAGRAAEARKVAGLTGDAALALGAVKDDMPPMLGLDIWVEGHVKHFGDKADTNGAFGVFYLGADYIVNPNILVGALIQWDYAEENSTALQYQVNGNGWMAGPYTTIKLGQNVYFDARAAWGTSDNRISPFLSYQDTFSTDRWLTSGNLTGTWNSGNWRLTPSVSVAYAQETSSGYFDANNTFVPSQTAELGRVTFGPEIAYRGHTSDGTLYEPHLSIKGLWDFKRDGDIKIDGIDVGAQEFRARIEGGLLVTAPSGFSFRATANAEGLGSGNFSSYGGEAWFNIPLH